jgi:hypothetical protein
LNAAAIQFQAKIENNSLKSKRKHQKKEELTGDMLQIGQNEWDQTHTMMSLI